MPHITIRHRKTRTERAMGAVSSAADAAVTFVKARIAWLAGRKATRVAVPAAAVGTAAVVAKKRSTGEKAGRQTPGDEDAATKPVAPAGIV